MTSTMMFDRARIDARSAAPVRLRPDRIADDMAMLRTAAELTRDLNAPRPIIYWTDLMLSCALGYGALAVAILLTNPWLVAPAIVVAILALYRAGSFIHELTHIRHASVPWFRFGWNMLVGNLIRSYS